MIFLPIDCLIERVAPHNEYHDTLAGVHGICEGFASLCLVYLSTVSQFYHQVLSMFALYQLSQVVVMQVVMRYTGNGTPTVAPRAPGRWTPAVRTALLGGALYLL